MLSRSRSFVYSVKLAVEILSNCEHSCRVRVVSDGTVAGGLVGHIVEFL